MGLLQQALDVFQVRGAALLSRPDDDAIRAGAGTGTGAPAGPGEGWRLVASAGEVPGFGSGAGESPGAASVHGDNVERIDATTCLVLYGRVLPASDRRLLGAFGVHLVAQLERQQLLASRSEVLKLAESNTMRTSILRAVSHDLRTPLAGIKLAVGGLRQEGVRYTRRRSRSCWQPSRTVRTGWKCLVGNLLDMSRITSDSINPLLRPVRWYEVIPGGLHGISPGRVRVELPPTCPRSTRTTGMLERVIANIVENAVKYAPESDIVLVGSAGGLGPATVSGRPAGELRIIDHGTGIPADRVVDMFRPFQRLDDATQATGVGLGLAVAKGFTDAMGGSLTAEATPGGGLTMVIRLPLSTGVPFRRSAAAGPAGAAVGGHRTAAIAPPLLASGTDAG